MFIFIHYFVETMCKCPSVETIINTLVETLNNTSVETNNFIHDDQFDLQPSWDWDRLVNSSYNLQIRYRNSTQTTQTTKTKRNISWLVLVKTKNQNFIKFNLLKCKNTIYKQSTECNCTTTHNPPLRHLPPLRQMPPLDHCIQG